MTILLIGIGNTLRRDDGAGAAVAEQVHERRFVRKLITHQLFPEHAELLHAFQHVVFIDAALDVFSVQFDEIHAEKSHPILGHHCDPSWILQTTKELFGHSPHAHLLRVPVHDLGFGEGFSENTNREIAVAVEWIEAWLDSLKKL
jgi:hydrogenase maturation protease